MLTLLGEHALERRPEGFVDDKVGHPFVRIGHCKETSKVSPGLGDRNRSERATALFRSGFRRVDEFLEILGDPCLP